MIRSVGRCPISFDLSECLISETLLGSSELIVIIISRQTWDLHQIEINRTHKLRGRGIGLFQAGEQHVIADAVGSEKVQNTNCIQM